MGQGWVLQFCSAETGSQALPPWATLVMMDLERVWTPPPQSWEQVEKAVQPERTQSMGQACVLQVLEAEGVGQATPP
jgi:hypothetical protein